MHRLKKSNIVGYRSRVDAHPPCKIVAGCFTRDDDGIRYEVIGTQGVVGVKTTVFPHLCIGQEEL